MSVTITSVQTYEDRIRSLEQQLQTLLAWQQNLISAQWNEVAHKERTQTILSEKTAIASEKHGAVVSVVDVPLTPPLTPPRSSSSASIDRVRLEPVAEEESVDVLSEKVLEVIQSYGQHLNEGSEERPQSWAGKAKFLPKVKSFVETGEPVGMMMPAFPWKSINRVDKVLGALPDFGEELALARLQAMCDDIKKVYAPGGQVTIATDGLAFNDVVGITELDTWEYSAALLTLAESCNFTSIKLVRVMNLLGMVSVNDTTQETYLNTVETCRAQLAAQFGNPTSHIRHLIETDNDSLLTYRGFIRFLETDLRHSPVAASAKSGSQYRKIVKEVAMQMMARAESFTKIIAAKCPEYVRLSIHPSSGAVKLSVPLIVQPDGRFPKSPWHSCIAVGVDGGYRTVHAKDVNDTHVLVQKHGRPYFYREKSDLYDWVGDGIELEHLYPSGVRFSAIKSAEATASMVADVERLQQLAEFQKVFAYGFTNIVDGEIMV